MFYYCVGTSCNNNKEKNKQGDISKFKPTFKSYVSSFISVKSLIHRKNDLIQIYYLYLHIF